MLTHRGKLALACVVAGIIVAVAAVLAVTEFRSLFGLVPAARPTQAPPERDLTPQAYFGTWNNVRRGGWTKVIITGSPAKPRVHIWGSCSPEDCDIGEEDGLWDGSALGVTFEPQSASTSGILSALTTFRLTMEGTDSLKLNCRSSRNLWNLFANGCVTMFYTRTP